MTKPFQVTTEMMNEVEAEISGSIESAHDAARTGAGTASVVRRPLDALHSKGAAPGPSDNKPAVAEDAINPTHYRKHPSGIECIEITRHMNFNTGNAVKYIWRHLDKGDPIENLKKAQWYLEDEIRRLERKR